MSEPIDLEFEARVRLVGRGIPVPCADGTDRPYLDLDAAASTPAFESVAQRVEEFLPWYSSVHRGAGLKSQVSTRAYDGAREAIERFAGRTGSDDVAIICRNTTEAINHLAYRLSIESGDVIVTTVAEHHANLLPWSRAAQKSGASIRYVECDRTGRFGLDDVVAQLDASPRPKLLAISGATNVTGWMPDLDAIVEAAHERGVRVLVDAAQLAPHRPMRTDADFLAWSGHKMYAPYGAGVLIGPRADFAEGDPFLAGGGAVDLVDLDEVLWTQPPEREEAGSPNVVGAVALGAAIETFEQIGWEAIVDHEVRVSRRLRTGLTAIDGVRLLGAPIDGDAHTTGTDDSRYLAVGTFVVENTPHPLVAARLSAEYGIGVRHGCFCAHPYLVRLLGLSTEETLRYRNDIVAGDRRNIPGAVRASASIATTDAEVDRFLDAVATIASGTPGPVGYEQDPATGDFHPVGNR